MQAEKSFPQRMRRRKGWDMGIDADIQDHGAVHSQGTNWRLHKDGTLIMEATEESDLITLGAFNEALLSGNPSARPSDPKHCAVRNIVVRGRVRMSGLPQGMCEKAPLLETVDLGEAIGLTSLFSRFYECRLLRKVDLGSIDGSGITTAAGAFEDCPLLTEVTLPARLPLLEDMENMFWGCVSLRFIDLSGTEMPRARIAKHMFAGCTSLRQVMLPDLRDLRNTMGMFSDCTSLVWTNLSQVTMEIPIKPAMGMFSNCASLTEVDLSGMSIHPRADLREMFNF